MPAYLGSGMIITWTSTAGTVTPNTDYLKFDYTPSVELVDQSAGADTAITSLAGLKSGKASLSWYQQAGGTAMKNALIEGQFGSLVFSPEGTVVGKPKTTFAAFSQGVKESYGYKDNSVYSVDFQQDGSRTESTW